jgi:hypothetical protein
MRHWLARWGKHVFFAIAVLAGLAADIIYRTLAYWDGYKTFESPPTLSVLAVFFMIIVACSLLAIASAAYLFISAAARVPRRCVHFGPFLIVVVLFVAIWTNTRHHQYYFVEGMRDWVSEHPSMVQEIDEWFHTLEEDKSLSKPGVYFIDSRESPLGEQHIKAEWPPCIKRLNPSSVRLVNEDGVWIGDVICGGGFLHWGIAICDRQETVTGRVWGYMMKVGPTAYVFVDAPESRLFDD